jgi:EAL domain-containing protein (putative c-di-GMP-specific phosphodiesterase class I)
VKLDVDFVKIDASIIQNVETDRNAQIIVKSIVSFAKELRIETIAEHVDSQSVYETVKGLGVDCSQGYFFGEPRAEI